MNNTISILGAGWLGQPLGKALVSEGAIVLGTTTTPSKKVELAEDGIRPEVAHLTEYGLKGHSESFFSSTKLIIAIPPPAYGDSFEQAIAHVCNQASGGGVDHILVVSSTSVYPSLNSAVQEDEVNPDSDRGKRMLEIENAFRNLWEGRLTIIRFGGLMGPGRNPGRFFAGRKDIGGGDIPVNMIHLEDCIGIIQTLLKPEIPDGIYHAATPHHPVKSEFYTQAAEIAGLEKPQFFPGMAEGYKIIDPEKLISATGYTFRFKNLFDALKAC